MILLPREIRKKLPALYSTDGQRGERKVICKFFTPDASRTWYVIEGEEKGDPGDWLFYGLIKGREFRLGYFTLNELLRVRGQLDLPVERDICFKEKTLAEVAPEYCEQLWGKE